MSVNEQLSIDLSGIDISGTGRIIMDNSGSFTTTGNISCSNITINNADISQIKLTSIDTSVNSEKILMINSSGNIDICSNFIGGIGPQGETGPQGASGPTGPAGSTTFTGLTDTPSVFTASKYLAVNSAGNAIELVDAPSGGGGGGGGAFTIDSGNAYYTDGNVGIGTNTPANKLSVPHTDNTSTDIPTSNRTDIMGGLIWRQPSSWGGNTAIGNKYYVENGSYGSGITQRYNIMMHDNSTMWLSSPEKIQFEQGNGVNVMTIVNQQVGIGTTNPGAGLHINSTGNQNVGPLTFYIQSNGTVTTGSQTLHNKPIGLMNEHRTWFKANVYFTSDERIKTDISSIQDSSALNIVNSLDIKEYHYIDPNRKGNNKTIGFIAQEVKEVLPNAVSVNKDFVPDEMRIIENPQWTQITDLSGNNKFKLEINNIDFSGNFTGKCKFYVTNDLSENDNNYKEIYVENDKKSFVFDESWNNVFLYGKEVNDFHTLDKNQIFALHHSAIQELSRENNRLKSEIATLKNINIDILNRLEKLEEDINKL